MTKALVLGAGMVGSVMAADLGAEAGWEVTIADLREASLQAAADRAARTDARVRTTRADLSDTSEVKRLAAEHDIVLGALSSVIGFQTLKAVIESKKPYCDIAFFAENALDLDALAKQHGVTAVVDCGVAPGISNMCCGHAVATLDQCHELEIYVGGLPRERRWPFQYKAGFSPYDVVEEYTRPSRIVENSKIVVREALSEPELMDFDGIGSLEAFNTDGLRSLAYTLKVPFMKEKTLRYPGHIELMRVFRETGLFSHDPIAVGKAGTQVRPIDVISALMFPKWTYSPGEEDLTVMRILARGIKRGSPTTLRWDLLDFYDRQTGATSMSRTTALPCTIMARMVMEGKYNAPGVSPPELVGAKPGLLDDMLRRLREKRVQYRFSETRE